LYLDGELDELRRLGYSIASETECEIVGVRNVWHWDAAATNMTYVVFLRATGPLSRSGIEAEYPRMIETARGLDPSRLPLGFQHGRMIVPVYSADRVEHDAVALIEAPQPMRFGEQVFPVAFDRSTGTAHYLRSTRLWGAGYAPKLRFLAQRLVEPESAPAREPLSWFMIALALVTVFVLLSTCGLLAAIFYTWQTVVTS